MSSLLLPPSWLVHVAVAAVWFYEGLWCKLLNRDPHQMQVAESLPRYGPRVAAGFLKSLGVVETALGIWVLIGIGPLLCATLQTVLLVTLNTGGVLWARRLIQDAGGMLVKNFAFLVLVWVSASLPAWR